MVVCRTYSRDWLMTFRDQCTSVPVGLEAGSDVMRESGQGPPSSVGRGGPSGGFDQRPRGGPPPQGPPGISMGGDDKQWKRGSMRGPDGMPPLGPPGTQLCPLHMPIPLHSQAFQVLHSYAVGFIVQRLGSRSQLCVQAWVGAG